MIELNESDSAISFRVRVQPRASRNEVAGEHGGAVKLKVTAPPVDGKANEACRQLLAALFDVSKSSVEIISGDSTRDKIIRVHGATARQARIVLERHSIEA